MSIRKSIRPGGYILVAIVACAVYSNSLKCGFVFDDVSAVRNNPDLRPKTPMLNIFINDFWGTPIKLEHSHKSYRPLCVLTFRLNFLLDELNPFGYHLVNVILHALVSLLYIRLCSMFLPEIPSIIAGLLFAVHPIHTEAVTGIVGRAEILSSIFFILAFLAYAKIVCDGKTMAFSFGITLTIACLFHLPELDWTGLMTYVTCITMATLCKEQGITVVGLCCAYEWIILSQKRVYLSNLLRNIQGFCAFRFSIPFWFWGIIFRILVLFVSSLSLLLLRLKVMGEQLPVFTKFDNPAAAAETPTRQLTYNYLLAVNAGLLLFPSSLCCDWTMGTIPLIESFFDNRNISTLCFYGIFVALIWSSFLERKQHSEVLIISLALMVFPMLPASNLFFPVGFVIAERILYIPSMGFCMLVAYGWHILCLKLPRIHIGIACLLILSCAHGVKTYIRNYDWESDYSLFMSGLRVNKRNAKLYNNVGHALESQGHYQEALKYFLMATRIQPDDIGAHMNVGRTLNNLKMFEQAEEAFKKAKDLLPHARAGESYHTRIAPSHLNVFLNLANLITRNGSRLEEADALYRQAITMRADYTQAYINRGDILIKLNRTQEAQQVYEKALEFDNSNPDLHYNLGVVLLETGKKQEALNYFNKAVELEADHELALMNSAILMIESGNQELKKTAYLRLLMLEENGSANEKVYFNLGMLAMDDKDYTNAEKYFRKATELRGDFRSALFNLALLLSNWNRPLEAIPVLKQLLKYHSDHIKGLILLGGIYINHVKDLDAAELCYKKILQLDYKNIQAIHNLCVVHVERGKFEEADLCLKKAAVFAPSERYIRQHLTIVKQRLSNMIRLKQSQRNFRNITYSTSIKQVQDNMQPAKRLSKSRYKTPVQIVKCAMPTKYTKRPKGSV